MAKKKLGDYCFHPSSKSFGGKRYSLVYETGDKRSAKKDVKERHGFGQNARLVSCPARRGGKNRRYGVYARYDKKRKR